MTNDFQFAFLRINNIRMNILFVTGSILHIIKHIYGNNCSNQPTAYLLKYRGIGRI